MKVQSDGVWRYPSAYATRSKGEWWIVLPTRDAELVALRAVVRTFDAEPYRAVASDKSLHEAVRHLRGQDWLVDDELAAQHLAEHFRQFCALELCQHGLPPWHSKSQRVTTTSPPGRRPSGSCLPATVRRQPAVRVADLQRMLTCWDRLENAHHALAHGSGLSAAFVSDLLAWPVLSPVLRRKYDAASTPRRDDPDQRHRGLDCDTSHQLVSDIVTALMQATRLTPVWLWERQQPPALAMRADTALALYTYDLLGRVGRRAHDNPDGDPLCDFCGEVFKPRRPLLAGQQHACSRKECRNGRVRVNTANSRARKRAQQQAAAL